MSDEMAVYASSGNVFADLGIENPEEYLAKSGLAAEILRIIPRQRLTRPRQARSWVCVSRRFQIDFEGASTVFLPTGCFASLRCLVTTSRSSYPKRPLIRGAT